MNEKLKTIQLVAKIKSKKKESLRPYIEYIRFPKFKNLNKDTKITFEFPLTVFVGKNGCGKTSALQAIYGAPKGKSTGDYWFSTNMDPISGEEKNRFIYSYFSEEAKKPVEVIKSRQQGRDKKTGKIKLDYWETEATRPKFGMDPMPNTTDNNIPLKGRSKTRWNTINKNVVYLDFRQELSAFDKAFYFSSFIGTKLKKQDYLRRQTNSGLLPIFNDQKNNYRNKKIYEKSKLSDKEIEWMNFILEKNYCSGHYIEHDLFGTYGFSVIFKTSQDMEYSEAFAGSGESSIAKLVKSILNTENRSLILLDEPEVSLYPEAQNRLKKFLLQQILEKNHQIIISSHSPMLVKGLPKEAIKLFHSIDYDHYFRVQNEAHPSRVFHHLGSLENSTTPTTVIVEDRLAKSLAEAAINIIRKERNIPDNEEIGINIKFLTGGVETIKKDYILYNSLEKNEKNLTFFLLDGDQKTEHKDPKNITQDEEKNLDNYIKKQTKTTVKFPASHTQEKIQQQKNYLKYYNNRVFYIPCKTPEEFIWKNGEKEHSGDKKTEISTTLSKTNDFKEKFEILTKYDLDKNTVSSDEIFQTQIRLIRNTKKSEDMITLVNTLTAISENNYSSINKKD